MLHIQDHVIAYCSDECDRITHIPKSAIALKIIEKLSAYLW